MKHCLVFASLISPSKMILFEKKYQTFDTVFHHQMKHLEVRQKYSAARRIFNSLLGVSSGDETLHLMFDILHKIHLARILKTLPPNRTRPSNNFVFCQKLQSSHYKNSKSATVAFFCRLVLTNGVSHPRSKNWRCTDKDQYFASYDYFSFALMCTTWSFDPFFLIQQWNTKRAQCVHSG